VDLIVLVDVKKEKNVLAKMKSVHADVKVNAIVMKIVSADAMMAKINVLAVKKSKHSIV
jgi:hypothetical protein